MRCVRREVFISSKKRENSSLTGVFHSWVLVLKKAWEIINYTLLSIAFLKSFIYVNYLCTRIRK